jgi:ABC-2 type transport system permease protein/capsular polysaccharide transport system permease protein
MFNNPSSSSLETENLNLEPHTPCSFWDSLMIQKRVIGALLMREILTRYGRHNIGFLWLFAEPMMFTLGVTILWNLMKHHSPDNISVTAFVLTGYSTVLLWRNMPARCVGAMQPNFSLLYHRQVIPFDVFVSRIVLEGAGATISLVILSIGFCGFGLVDPPEDYLKVIAGWLLLAWFAASLSFFIGAFSERSELIDKFWHPITYLILPLSGSMFMVDPLPPAAQEMALLMPTVSCIELFREGYLGMGHRWHYDIPYVVVFNLVLMFFGLAEVRNMSRNLSLD